MISFVRIKNWFDLKCRLEYHHDVIRMKGCVVLDYWCHIIKAITKTRLCEKRNFRFSPVFSILCGKIEIFCKNHVFCIKSVFGMKTCIVFSFFFVVFVKILLL